MTYLFLMKAKHRLQCSCMIDSNETISSSNRTSRSGLKISYTKVKCIYQCLRINTDCVRHIAIGIVKANALVSFNVVRIAQQNLIARLVRKLNIIHDLPSLTPKIMTNQLIHRGANRWL